MKAQSPQLRLRIMGDTSDQVLRLLDQRRIDLAIARRRIAGDSEAYDFEALGNERLLVVVRSGHVLARRRKLSWEELVRDWPGSCSRPALRTHRAGPAAAQPGAAGAGRCHRVQLRLLDAAVGAADGRGDAAVGLGP
ncbi:LysR substrate-binding domain-containing protein [Comamonas sp. JC664]